MRSEVQLLPGPPIRGLSSVGRAVALQAGGHRFDPDRLHQPTNSRDEDTISCLRAGNAESYLRCFFDIVNGFLIDAVVHWFACAQGREVLCVLQVSASLTDEISG